RRVRSERLAVRARRVTRPGLARRYVAEDAGLRSEPRPGPYGMMSAHSHLSGEDAAVADLHRSRDPHLCHDQTEPSDAHVVRYVHQVVYLRSRAHHGVVHAPPVERRVGTNLHIVLDDAAAHVWN